LQIEASKNSTDPPAGRQLTLRRQIGSKVRENLQISQENTTRRGKYPNLSGCAAVSGLRPV
jgi:hypothetical protein